MHFLDLLGIRSGLFTHSIHQFHFPAREKGVKKVIPFHHPVRAPTKFMHGCKIKSNTNKQTNKRHEQSVSQTQNTHTLTSTINKSFFLRHGLIYLSLSLFLLNSQLAHHLSYLLVVACSSIFLFFHALLVGLFDLAGFG